MPTKKKSATTSRTKGKAKVASARRKTAAKRNGKASKASAKPAKRAVKAAKRATRRPARGSAMTGRRGSKPKPTVGATVVAPAQNGAGSNGSGPVANFQPSPSKNTARKNHQTSPATAAPPDVYKHEEMERAGTIVRAAHAAVRTRRQGG